MEILVTGGTGTLGRELVPVLRSRGLVAHVLSRRAHPGLRTADLGTGEGVDAALRGVDTVVHLAAGRRQEEEARTLVTAAERAGIRNLVFISIVGVDEIPLPYYRAKLAAERVVTQSGVPHSVFRTTQFHTLVAGLFEAQRRLPVLFAPRLRVQPIDPRVVADVLADLAVGRPQGRIPDLGGPEVLTGDAAARAYRAHRGWRRPIVPVALPGRTWAGYASGAHLVPANRSGGRTFGEFVASSRAR